jgi:hypothetical protein
VDDIDSIDMSNVTMVYVNFTDGLAIASHVLERINAPVQVTRMRSSHLECGDWVKFVWSVPEDMLYRIAAGKPFIFVDAGSRRRDCIPRTIWQGLPTLLHIVARIVWMRLLPVASMFLAEQIGLHTAMAVDRQAWQVSKQLDKPLRNRIRYWRRYATPDPAFHVLAVYGCGAIDHDEAARIYTELRHKL